MIGFECCSGCEPKCFHNVGKEEQAIEVYEAPPSRQLRSTMRHCSPQKGVGCGENPRILSHSTIQACRLSQFTLNLAFVYTCAIQHTLYMICKRSLQMPE